MLCQTVQHPCRLGVLTYTSTITGRAWYRQSSTARAPACTPWGAKQATSPTPWRGPGSHGALQHRRSPPRTLTTHVEGQTARLRDDMFPVHVGLLLVDVFPHRIVVFHFRFVLCSSTHSHQLCAIEARTHGHVRPRPMPPQLPVPAVQNSAASRRVHAARSARLTRRLAACKRTGWTATAHTHHDGVTIAAPSPSSSTATTSQRLARG